MLDLAFVRANLELVEEKLRGRGGDPASLLKSFRNMDQSRRNAITVAEQTKAQLNRLSQQMGTLRKSGQDDSALMAEIRDLKKKMEELNEYSAKSDYALHDLWLGGDRSAVSTISLRLSQGVPGLGASSQGNASAGRLNERLDFTKVSFEASRTQVLFSPWQNATVAVQPLLAGQYSADVLPSAEEFFLGGLRFDRGFYSGQVTGDKALTAATELQLNTSFPVTALGDPFDLGSQFYGFYDWGETWQNQKTDRNGRLASAGLGVRLYFPKAVEVDLEGVERLTRRPLGIAAEVNQLPGTGMYWRLLCRF